MEVGICPRFVRPFSVCMKGLFLFALPAEPVCFPWTMMAFSYNYTNILTMLVLTESLPVEIYGRYSYRRGED